MTKKLMHLANRKFIGDLSLQDADIICYLADNYGRVLEFGVGGSTQLFAQGHGIGRLVCVETDPAWTALTKERLGMLDINVQPKFHSYEDLSLILPNEKFDVIFVDGVDHLRLEFACKAWDSLLPGGIMLFHDTRRAQDFKNVAWVAQLHFDEIEAIEINRPGSDHKPSNMTLIYKNNAPVKYENWNYTEDKPLSAYSVPGTASFDFWSQETYK